MSASFFGSSGDDPYTMPEIHVTADAIDDSSFGSSLWGMFTAVSIVPPEQDQSIDQDGPDDFELTDEQQIQLLSNSPEFQDLPEEVQERLLASPTAVDQLVEFLKQGGQIDVDPNLDVAARYEGDPPRITIGGDAFAAASTGPLSEYRSEILTMGIAHELGHFMTDTLHEWQGGTIGDYYDYRAEKEALAIVNEWNIGSEIEGAGFDVIWSSYGNESDYATLFNDFNQHQDFDRLIEDIANTVRNYTPPNFNTDVNNDGTIDVTDRWKQDWDNGYR